MKKLHRAIFAAVALAIVMIAFELIRPVTVLGDPIKDMRVINTAAEAVPTTVQRTVLVSGAVTGVVQAQQSGPWNVGISRGQIWKVGVFPGPGPERIGFPLALNCGKTPTFQI